MANIGQDHRKLKIESINFQLSMQRSPLMSGNDAVPQKFYRLHRSGDGIFYPSTQRLSRRLIYYLYYIATCFGRTTIIKQEIY
jgi:hypothetical protein